MELTDGNIPCCCCFVDAVFTLHEGKPQPLLHLNTYFLIGNPQHVISVIKPNQVQVTAKQKSKET